MTSNVNYLGMDRTQSLCWCKPKYCDNVNGCMQSSGGMNFDIVYMTYPMKHLKDPFFLYQTRVSLMFFNSIICNFIVKLK